MAVIFLRVPDDTKKVLVETLRGMNASRPTGDPAWTLNSLVVRLVHEGVLPSQAAPDPRQLTLELERKQQRAKRERRAKRKAKGGGK